MNQRSPYFTFARHLSSLARSVTESNMMLKAGLFLAFEIFLIFYLDLSFSVGTFLVFCVYLSTGGYRFVIIALKTLPRDARGLHVLISVNLNCYIYRKKNYTIAKIFQETCKKYPTKTAFLYEDKKWTYHDVDTYSNAIANYFYEKGYRKGDIVSIFLENRPEFVCLWLGLSKIGVIAALINYNLRNTSLAHCINVSKASALIFSAEVTEATKDVLPLLSRKLELYSFGESVSNSLHATSLDTVLKGASSYPPPSITAQFKDKLFYIYTSGTTGLPKAAVVTHIRYFYMSYALSIFLKITDQDILYDILPLYHSAGGVVGIGQCLINGVTVAIRKKFSASQFWDDCVKFKCTTALYIGEICRYLLAQPFKKAEQQHRVRLMFGNGLKPQIWKDFQQRFGVKQMGEFYGATEGNCNMVNCMNKVGAVGFTTRIAPIFYPITLIKVDPNTGKHMRDKNGICIRSQPGEAGELVGKIVEGDPLREFDGYVNNTATEKKVARDVFRKGDLAFLTGDILVMDELGYMYFKDRTGDTFRWKGENVSTNEVEAVVSNFVKLNDAVAYGVEVPGNEGCAGMVAIVDENLSINLDDLNQALQRSLPSYARPVFIRICRTVSTTGTFKLIKTDLRKEGYNPAVVTDKLFYLDLKSKQYVPLTPERYTDINDGKIRF